jgi:NAD(P)-dependent dehydrogenase (short-subunit alcohol dehydrogenase family)
MNPKPARAKVALVTGASGGIGRAIAQRLVDEGLVVIGAQRSTEAGRSTGGNPGSGGGVALSLGTDIRDEDSVVGLFETIEQEFGRLDVLCNNAGIGGVSALNTLDISHYNDVMDTNVRGALLCTKHAIRLIDAAGGGAIINIASLGSFVGIPSSASYCASKGAVLAFTREAAVELAPRRIRVNAVAPGYIDNEMFHSYIRAQDNPAAALDEVMRGIPLSRLGTTEDVAAAVAFLASDDAKWITGTTLVVDGGTLCQ